MFCHVHQRADSEKLRVLFIEQTERPPQSHEKHLEQVKAVPDNGSFIFNQALISSLNLSLFVFYHRILLPVSLLYKSIYRKEDNEGQHSLRAELRC